MDNTQFIEGFINRRNPESSLPVRTSEDFYNKYKNNIYATKLDKLGEWSMSLTPRENKGINLVQYFRDLFRVINCSSLRVATEDSLTLDTGERSYITFRSNDLESISLSLTGSEYTLIVKGKNVYLSLSSADGNLDASGLSDLFRTVLK